MQASVPTKLADPDPAAQPLGSSGLRGVGVVSRRLEYALAALPNAADEAVQELEQAFERELCPTLDYEMLAVPFARRYLMINYWKSIMALREVLRGKTFGPEPVRIVDLGAGSAATTVAMLALVDELSVVETPVEVILIDRSSGQLALGAELIAAVRTALPGLRVEVQSETIDISTQTPWVSLLEGATFVLASHVLTENFEEADRLLLAILSAVGPDTETVVIERVDDTVWGKIEEAGTHAALPMVLGEFGVAAEDLPGGLNGRLSGWLSVRYGRWTSPADARLPETVRRYFAAWATKSASLLDDVFTNDAEYVERPFGEPLLGLDAIRAYWVATVCSQTDPRPRVIGSTYEERVAMIEWSTAMRRGRRDKTVTGAMILTFDAETARIRTLREYFDSSELIERA